MEVNTRSTRASGTNCVTTGTDSGGHPRRRLRSSRHRTWLVHRIGIYAPRLRRARPSGVLAGVDAIDAPVEKEPRKAVGTGVHDRSPFPSWDGCRLRLAPRST